MADETSRATDPNTVTRASPVKEFSNVEFLDSALANPLNVLRAKLKELSDLPDGVLTGRVLIITEVHNDDGRGFDVVWSEGDDESACVVQDSILAMLTRVKNALSSGGD